MLAQAARRIGAHLLALNHQLQRAEVLSLLAASGATLVWASAAFAGVFDRIEEESDVTAVVVFAGEAGPDQVAAAEFVAGQPCDRLVDPAGAPAARPPARAAVSTGAGPATFTGGTTGRPKGVIYDRRRLERAVPYTRIEDEIYAGGPHVFLTSGSISHGGPFSHANLVLAKGGTVILQQRFDPVDWLRLVTRYRVTASYCPPTVIRRICALAPEVRSRYDLASVRVIVAGAAKWSYALKLAYREVFPPGTLWELYGSSELGSNIVMRPDEHWDRPESSGRPLEGYTVVLRGEDGAAIDRPYEPGVMYVNGPFVLFDGYEGDEEATVAARWGDLWTVGDVAYVDEDGYYYVCGRSKDMFVSGGVNVYPAEIEAVLDAYPGVSESAALGVPDDEWGERSHALVVARAGADLDAEEIGRFCRERLASFKAPGEIEIVDELPHTLAGKVDKLSLRRTYWQHVGRTI